MVASFSLRTNALEHRDTNLSNDERIVAFEAGLPFESLFIDDFERLVMTVAKVKKVNGIYEPRLSKSYCELRRIVKYFKTYDHWTELQNPQSSLCQLLKSLFLSR